VCLPGQLGPAPSLLERGWNTPRRPPETGGYVTRNFVVYCADRELARKIGDWAEHWRKEKAVEWLGQEMPPWGVRCPLYAQVDANAGGYTAFAFTDGAIRSQEMHVRGPADRIVQSVLPHEITHTVLAYRFRRPLPRWADEGAAVLSEDEVEHRRQEAVLEQCFARRTHYSLSQLVRLTDYPQQSDRILSLYAQGYSVTRYLVELKDRSAFLRFLGDGLGGDWDGALRRHYEIAGLADLEGRWLTWCRRRGRPAGGTVPGSVPAAVPEPPGGAGLPDDRSRLADILQRLERAHQIAEGLREQVQGLRAEQTGTTGRVLGILDRLDGVGDLAAKVKAAEPALAAAAEFAGWGKFLPWIAGGAASGGAVPLVWAGLALGRSLLRRFVRKPGTDQGGNRIPAAHGTPQEGPVGTATGSAVTLPPTPSPPLPQIVRTERQFVPYETPSAELQALKLAMDEYVKLHPGARATVETIEAYARQIHSGMDKTKVSAPAMGTIGA
jgi:hypothetical protein